MVFSQLPAEQHLELICHIAGGGIRDFVIYFHFINSKGLLQLVSSLLTQCFMRLTVFGA